MSCCEASLFYAALLTTQEILCRNDRALKTLSRFTVNSMVL